MCSVVGCDSWRRSAQRFKLPEDPEERLEWVQFLGEANRQRFKESCWTDITICIEHFAPHCYEQLSPAGRVQLKPRAVPSLCLKSEPEEDLESPQHVEALETTEVASQCDITILHGPNPCSQNIKANSNGSLASPGPSVVSLSCSPDVSNTGQMQQDVMNIDCNQEKAPYVPMEGKVVVNGNSLIQLFRSRCPSCGGTLQMEKVTHGIPIIFKQQCLQCEYRHQWKSQVNSAPTADQHLTGSIDVTPEIQQELMETTEVACQCDLKTYDSPTSCFEESRVNSNGSQASPGSCGASSSCSPDVSNTVSFGQMQQNIINIDLNQEKAAHLQMKGKVVVYENCLMQLFRHKCPSCGGKLQMEKVTHGILIILNQQCLHCEYRNQWKSQVNAIVPTAEDQHLAEGTEVTQQTKLIDVDPSRAVSSEIVTFSDEESNLSDEGEECDQGAVSSDGEWNPTEDILLAEELTKGSDEETEEEGDFDSRSGLRINELCTECGSFFNILKPHTCEYKIKPYSCNICGKRCVSESSLKHHSNIHDETYEHPCKYCHVTFRTRVDKLKHEETHQDSVTPYKCPDCSETFATSKERSIHLADHRISKEFRCGVCGIEFRDRPHLQRHSVVHTGLKPYKCSECQRSFSQSSHLKSHLRLHTGERPFKCQHCDKCFNHNVSLKSHVQRYHKSTSGCERKKSKESDASDAQEERSQKGTDLEVDNVEEEQHTEEEVQNERITTAKMKGRRSTGRPIGRPKRDAAGNLILGNQLEGKGLNTKTGKVKVQKSKRKRSSNEETEDEMTDSDTSFDSGGEEEVVEVEERNKTLRKNTGRGKTKSKNDSDSDFDPEEETKQKRYSSQSSGKSSGKSRGRSNKSLMV